MSWMTKDGGDAVVGNPIGMGSNLTFTGSGELDNGWTFGLTVAMLNNDAYSSTAVNLDMGSLGSLNFNQGDSGNGIDAFDDKMPTAWEEPWGAGLGTGIQLVSGVGTQVNVQYKSPTIAGITFTGAMAPDVGAADANDKGNTSTTDITGRAYDGTLNVNPSFGTEILSGLNLFVGGSMTEHYNETAGLNNRYEAVAGATLDLGPISVGYAMSGISTGKTTNPADMDAYKNHMYGIAFNINDDLSISYGFHDSQGFTVSGSDSSYTAGQELDNKVITEVESTQIAYTMGGASIRLADIDVDNASYQTAAAFDKSARLLSVSLAF
jgi:outer membrane protein OmpU